MHAGEIETDVALVIPQASGALAQVLADSRMDH